MSISTIFSSDLSFKKVRLNGVFTDTSGDDCIAIGNLSGAFSQGDNTVAIGFNAGCNAQGSNALAVGLNAGRASQGIQAVAVGAAAGCNSQGQGSVAIGVAAGCNSQAAECVAIGSGAGRSSQGLYGVAIGSDAGLTSQGQDSVAIGNDAGSTSQGLQCVALGAVSGNLNQGQFAVAIGGGAGSNAQGARAIAVGYYAGASNQGAGSIVIDASGSAGDFIAASAGRCYIRPIGSQVASSALNYNATTKEVHLVTSSKEHKTDIEPLHEDTSKLHQLEPKQFKYKEGLVDDLSVQYGFIAEEAADILDKFATYITEEVEEEQPDEEAQDEPRMKLVKVQKQKPFNINWNVLTTFLIAEVKKLRQEVDELKSRQ